MFKTNDTAWFRIHKDDANLMQVIYQIISAYFEDDCADELTNEPVMTAILDKDALASQPTLSRFYNRMDEDKNQALYRATKFNQVDYAVEYGEFMYQAGSWSHPRRVVFKIEKPYGQMIHLYTFIVTTMEMEPYQVLQFYCGRGKMENFIKEGKSGFDFASVSSSSRLVNANRLLVHTLAYNLFNWFRRLALAVSMRKQRIDTIRLKLLKIAARVENQHDTNISSCVAVVPKRKNFMRHRKIYVICNHSWNDNF